jgi:hypothetical protein
MTDVIPRGRHGIRPVVRSELTKLGSVRSTVWTLLALVVGSVVVTALATASVHHHGRSGGFDPTNMSLTGLAPGSLVIGILGVLAITGEYGTGTIRSSLAATPRRPLLLGAKAMVIGGISLVVGELLSFACFFIGQSILSGHAPTAHIGQAGVWHSVLMSGAYLALLGLFALGLGTVIRHTAGAVAAFVGCTLLLPILLQPLTAHGNPARFAPEAIFSNSVAAVVPQSGQLSPAVGFLMMALYCAVALGLGAALLARRDA